MIEIFNISKYRTPLMGISMLWIMLYHIGIDVPYLNLLTRSGYLGVDIFIFLSSYGLYYSLVRKKVTNFYFYKKRLFRILPTYYITLMMIFLIKGLYFHQFDVIKLLQDSSFIGFFFPNLRWSFFLWYIPATIFLYILFPYLFYNLKYIKKYWALALIFSVIFIFNYYLTTVVFTHGYNKFSLLLLIPRIFVFILGLIWADIEKKYNYIITKNWYIFFILLLLSLCIITLAKINLSYFNLRLYMLETTPFILGIPGIFIIFIKIYNISPIFIKKLIMYSGTYSLELYCVHESLYLLSYKLTHYSQINIIYSFIIFIVISFICAYILKKISALIQYT